MSRWGWLGLVLAVVGTAAGAPGLILVGAMATLVALLTTVWSKYGLRRVRYERTLPRDRAVWGDEVPLDISVWNAKILPLAWLEIEDFLSDGTVIREVPSQRSERPGYQVLRTTWTLASFEQVIRHFHLVADHRGYFRFGPARLHAADLFGRDISTVEDPAPGGFLVRPRTVPVTLSDPEVAPLGIHRARRGLHEDPALFAGVRPYQMGDPRNRMHWRATARLNRPVVKRFEPAMERQAVIALDVQTTDDAYWMMTFEEELLESLMVAAASLARYVIDDGASCGLAAAAWTGRIARIAFVPPATGAAQLALISDVLGRMSSFSSAPFEVLLNELPRRLTPGTSVLVVSSRDPAPTLAAEVQLTRAGFPVTHMAMGDRRDEWADRANRAGLPGRTAHLPDGWRTSDGLELAG
jgi:uncharacterized protein (DUF58 family)